MPDNIPKYLIKLIPQFIRSLEDNYPNHNTILSFDSAAKTAAKLLKESGQDHKVEASDIRRLVNYLIDEGAFIGILADGCYWAGTWAELEFSIGYIAGRYAYYGKRLESLNKIKDKLLEGQPA
jgi:hypothetical protein